MKISQILYAVFMVMFFAVFMSYFALPLLLIAVAWFVFSEVKKRFFPSPIYGRFSQDSQQTADEDLPAGQIIDVEFHEV